MKKSGMKFVCSVLLLTVICVLCQPMFCVKAEATENDDYIKSRAGYAAQKTDVMREVYVRIANMVLNMESSVHFETELGITRDDIVFVANWAKEDFPEAFYFRGSLVTKKQVDGSFTVEPVYNIDNKFYHPTSSACNPDLTIVYERKQILEEKVDRIINNIPDCVQTDYDKSLYVYTYLVDNITYDSSLNAQTAYGALVNGKAVCAGYAAAYALLMNRLGVKTWYVQGTSSNGAGQSQHAWNVSWLDGVCVYTDATWGDTSGYNGFKYFNISGTQMAKDHTLDVSYDGLLEACNHTDYMYKPQTIKVSNISVTTSNNSITEKGGTIQLKTTISPSTATDKSLKYSSSNTKVATVSSSGKVTAVGEGTATITIQSKDGGASTTFVVTVDFPEHTHSIVKKTAVAATCTKEGCKAYYYCTSCDALFLDANGQSTLTDIKTMRIPATGHSTGSWDWNNEQHWKKCSACQAALTETVSRHQFGSDLVCACGFEEEPTVPETTEPEVTEPESTEQPTTTPSAPADPKEPPVSSEPEETEPTDPGCTEPSEGLTEPSGTEGTTDPTNQTTATQEATRAPETSNSSSEQATDGTGGDAGSNQMLVILLGCLVGILIIAVIVGTVIVVISTRKKK